MSNRAERRRLEKQAKKSAKRAGGADSPEAVTRSHEIYNEALALQQQGKIPQAITRYKDALKLNANLAEASNNLGNLYEIQNKWQDAETAYQRALKIYPDNVMLLSNLGNVLRRQDKLEEASEILLQALQYDPESIQAMNNLGNVLLAQNKPNDALAYFRRAIESDPAVLESKINLGAALEASGEYNGALQVMEEARKQAPNSAVIYYNLGHILANQKKTDEAMAMYEQALTLKPDYVQASFNLANLYRKGGDTEAAAEIYRQLLIDNPKQVDAYLELGEMMRHVGDHEGAVKILTHAVKVLPTSTKIYDGLGSNLHELGKHKEAINAFSKAIKYDPENVRAHIGLGLVYASLYQYDEAIKSYWNALVYDPNNGAAYNNLAGTLHDQGKLEEAIAIYRQALSMTELKETTANIIYSNYLLVQNYSATISQQSLFEAHLEFAKRFELPIQNIQGIFSPEIDSKRKIRIGYVSADFREHSVVYFIEPLLTHYDRERFEVICYYDLAKTDAYTSRLQQSVDGWHGIVGQSDEEVSELIRRDQIDILVDLAGHTNAGARLLVFARKPAPVQVTYLGYPNTTGLASMDYRLTDAWADPDGQEQYHTEKLLRLDSGFLCYHLPQSLPEINDAPVMQNGYVTFGSFNNLAKTVPEVIALWSRILLQIPNARLLLKNKSFRDEAVRADYLEKFIQHGLTSDRLELIGYLENKADHLGLYQRVDICLDTFPYNGTTTTCEALSMGVPVITLCGSRHASRVGNSLLHQVQLESLIAHSEDEYVCLAVELAADTGRLQNLRQGMRDRLRDSALCDETGFCRHVEASYTQIWENRTSIK